MPRFKTAPIATSILLTLPACSLLIDTNPDGVVIKGGAAGVGGKDKGGSSSGGHVNAGNSSTALGGSIAGSNSGAAAGSLSNVGGTSSAGSTSTAQGGTLANGGAVATSGNGPGVGGVAANGGAATAGGVSTGGTSANGGATAGSTSKGGTTSTGGVGTGGAATAGAPTAGTSGCGDTQSSANNCGACGHSCLGGACVQGMCQPAIVVKQESVADGLVIWAMGDGYVYYAQGFGDASPRYKMWRVSTDATGGTGTLLTTHSCGTVLSVTSSKLYYNSYPCGEPSTMDQPIETFSCSTSNCTTPAVTIGTPRVAGSKTSTPYVVTLDRACDANLCINWLNADNQSVALYRDNSMMPAILPHSGGNYDSMAYGDKVYWVQILNDIAGQPYAPCLLTIDRTTMSRAQLAGQVTSMQIADVNPHSVLFRATSSLRRVPLPLGLGNSPPLDLGVTGTGAAEDSTGIYWVDLNGTVFHCSPSDCSATQKVLANGQTSAGGIGLDGKAVYWGRANPPAIMRLAK